MEKFDLSEMERYKRSAPWRPLLIIGLLALAVRIFYLLESADNPFRHHLDLDIRLYHLWAISILDGTSFGPGPFLQAPLYPYFLAGCYALLGRGPEAVLWIQVLLGAITTVLGARIAERYWGRAGMIATGLLLAFYKPAIFYTGIMLVPTVATTLLAAVLLVAPMRPAIGGFLTGLTALAHPVLLPGTLIAALGLSRRDRRAWLMILVGLMAALAPVTIYNYIKGGGFSPVSVNTGINFYIGNGPNANGFYTPPLGMRGDEDPIGISEANRRSGRPLSPSEASRFWMTEAQKTIKDDPGRTASLYFRKLVTALGAYETPQIESFDFEKSYSVLLRLPVLPNWLCLISIAIFALVIRYRDRNLRFMIIAALVTAGVIALFFVTARFRLPTHLFLALAAGGGISALLSGLTGNQVANKRPIAFGLVAVILSIAILSPNWFGIARDKSNGAYLYRLGIFAERDGDQDEAADLYTAAIAADDSHARATINLGILSARSGDLGRARTLLEKGLILDPNSARGLLALGQIHQVNRELTAAIELYERAWAEDRNLMRSLEFLTTALYASGDVRAAEQRAQELISLTGPDAPLARRCRFILERINERKRNGWTGPLPGAVADGDLAFAVNDLSTAAKRYTEALANDPNNLIGLFQLARLFSAQGNQDASRSMIERFLASGGDSATLSEFTWY